jgi:O-antigen ligase
LWGLLAAALILSLTRGAWLGAMAGIGLLLALHNWRWCVAGMATLALVYMLLPAPFHERVLSSFDLNDATTRGRIALLRTGLILVEASPWTGVGPRLVWPAAVANRQEHDLPDDLYQHLHNNLLQVAAELGVPALAAWLAIWVRITWDLIGFRRRGDSLSAALASGGLAAMASFHVMGLFEYNFGDSEISLLMFFLLLLPYCAARGMKVQES